MNPALSICQHHVCCFSLVIPQPPVGVRLPQWKMRCSETLSQACPRGTAADHIEAVVILTIDFFF